MFKPQQKFLEKLVTQYGKYKDHQNCAFGKSRGRLIPGDKTFGENYVFEFTPEDVYAFNDANWKVDNWIDGDNYNACAAMQHVLTGKKLIYI